MAFGNTIGRGIPLAWVTTPTGVSAPPRTSAPAVPSPPHSQVSDAVSLSAALPPSTPAAEAAPASASPASQKPVAVSAPTFLDGDAFSAASSVALGASSAPAVSPSSLEAVVANPNLKVRARGTIGGLTFEDTNQMARVGGRADEATLIADRVCTREAKNKKVLPNGNMATAHAEVGVLQQAFEAGATQGAHMDLLVEGKPVCGHCLGDIPAMADKAGLKSLTVREEATGKVLHWEPGFRSLKAKE